MPYSVSSILGFVIKWQINVVKERKNNLLPSGCPTAYIPPNAYPERTTQLPFNGM